MLLLVLKKVFRTQTNNQNAVFCESRQRLKTILPKHYTSDISRGSKYVSSVAPIDILLYHCH